MHYNYWRRGNLEAFGDFEETSESLIRKLPLRSYPPTNDVGTKTEKLGVLASVNKNSGEDKPRLPHQWRSATGPTIAFF